MTKLPNIADIIAGYVVTIGLMITLNAGWCKSKKNKWLPGTLLDPTIQPYPVNDVTRASPE